VLCINADCVCVRCSKYKWNISTLNPVFYESWSLNCLLPVAAEEEAPPAAEETPAPEAEAVAEAEEKPTEG
jgi:hypothetical protein